VHLFSRGLLAWVLAFSALVVWSHWNLFSTGVLALGFNYSLFYVGFALILYYSDKSYRFKQDWVWLCPIVLIGLSYSLYENPWLKLVSLIVLPVAIGVFCAYHHFDNRRVLLWNRKLLGAIFDRLIAPVGATAEVIMGIMAQLRHSNEGAHKGVLVRALVGISILIPLGLVAILLLSSADALFKEAVQRAFDTALGAISWFMLLKLVLSLLLAIALLSVAVAWSVKIDYTESAETRTIDGLMAGIVLGGLLLIYVAFLSLQLDNLVIETLPEDYREAEHMVKSGFWQLFLLAVLNTGLFFIVYRNTGSTAQWVLRAFIAASSLLMVSAAWKVLLYSYTFGLSYEKFFACYTAIFALGVLMYLVKASFSGYRRNAVKVIAFAALWGYGLATITPVEKVIFHTNLHLSQKENTRITINQLTQLSADVYADANRVYSSKLALDNESEALWNRWRDKQKRSACERRWYEFNLSIVGVAKDGTDCPNETGSTLLLY